MLLDCVADFKSAIEPDVHNHTAPLSIRIMKDNSGHAEFRYRHKTADKKWLPKEGDGLHLLTVSTSPTHYNDMF